MNSYEIKNSGSEKENIKILVLDDNEGHLDAIFQEISLMGFEAVTAEHGREGCRKMKEYGNEISTIILDREMPVMDGMEFIEWLKKNNFENIPVIMVTQDQQPETIKQGIDAGVFYYLHKPLQVEVLHSVLNAAVTASKRQILLNKEVTSHSKSISLINKCLFYVKTLEDAESTACFAANFFPNPEKALQGIAELIINGVEHGNLGITYDEKTDLLKNKIWRQEIEKRQQLPENINKQVTVYFEKTADSYNLVVKDQGNGFDWKKYSDINPSRALHNHGRGIAQAKLMSFDELNYNSKGNELKAIVYKNKSSTTIDWD